MITAGRRKVSWCGREDRCTGWLTVAVAFWEGLASWLVLDGLASCPVRVDEGLGGRVVGVGGDRVRLVGIELGHGVAGG